MQIKIDGWWSDPTNLAAQNAVKEYIQMVNLVGG